MQARMHRSTTSCLQMVLADRLRMFTRPWLGALRKNAAACSLFFYHRIMLPELGPSKLLGIGVAKQSLTAASSSGFPIQARQHERIPIRALQFSEPSEILSVCPESTFLVFFVRAARLLNMCVSRARSFHSLQTCIQHALVDYMPSRWRIALENHVLPAGPQAGCWNSHTSSQECSFLSLSKSF